MPTSAWPSVVTASIAVATSATIAADVRVVRGREISNDPGDVVMIGVQDPELVDWDSAGSFEQSRQTYGGNRAEEGTVNGLVVAWNGDADQDAACSTAFAHFALIETAVRANQTLGLTAFDYIVAEIQAGDVRESQNADGASAALSFVISYQARI